MPEIKHTFTGGKMNKDLDERLVPKDQYRDAMNVQVSSSDDSDVGTVQNILGNSEITLPISKYDSRGEELSYHCVGSISDEKNDTSYWFLSGEMFNDLETFQWVSMSNLNSDISIKDYIISRSFNFKTNSYQNINVFTDYKRFYSRTIPALDPSVRRIDAVSRKIYLPLEGLSNLNIGDNLIGIIDNLGNKFRQNTKIIHINSSLPSLGVSGLYDNYIIVDNIHGDLSSLADEGWLVLEFSMGCLSFNHNTITAINIIDNLLFWTDGVSEPRVINIHRSIAGTTAGGISATRLYNSNLLAAGSPRMSKQDVYVIKRKPTKKLTLEYDTFNRSGVTRGTVTTNFTNSASGLTVLNDIGYNGVMEITAAGGGELNYEIGDTLLLLNETSIDSGDKILPYEYDVKIIIKDIDFNTVLGTNTVNYEILSRSLTTPILESNFSVILDERAFTKFENEMVRFSYRYRYFDKEISAFAPFTDLVFEASNFLYTKDNAFNTGMVNNIVNLKLKDFVDIKNTLAVESIDLLVKFEGSPLVYIIDTIKRSLFPTEVNVYDSAFDGEYEFNPQNIKGTVPENQMLRPWDAVPRVAKSQEIIGNRIVYGNYVSDYYFSHTNLNLNISNINRSLDIDTSSFQGGPSIKSKRDYQLGIVLVDENGRESPVFNNNDSSVNISKSESGSHNMFSVVNNSLLPSWVKGYKYYIKDSSLPHYNIVVDAFYKAENGDFWLAVPSSERNKVQEGDFLELKKGINSNKALNLEHSTKAIAIKNEPPEFIASTWRSLGRVRAEYERSVGGVTIPFDLFQYANNMPQVGVKSFNINKNVWLRQHNDDLDDNNVHKGFGGGAHLDREGLTDLSVKFFSDPGEADFDYSGVLGGGFESGHYSCGRITIEGDDEDIYNITLDEPIKTEDSWLTTSSSTIFKDLCIEIFEKTKVPRARFEGKFFIKIEATEDFLANIAPNEATTSHEINVHEIPIFNFGEQQGGNISIGSIATPGNTLTYDVNNDLTGLAANATMDTYGEWESLFNYQSVNIGETVPSYWFVDRLQYYKAIRHSVPLFGLQYHFVQVPLNDNGDVIAPKHGLGVFKSEQQHLNPDFNVDPATSPLPYYVYSSEGFGPPQDFVNIEGKYYIELSCVGLMNDIEGDSIDPLVQERPNLNYLGEHTQYPGILLGGDLEDCFTRSITQGYERTASGAGIWPYYTQDQIDNGQNRAVKNPNNVNKETLKYLRTIGQKFKWEGGQTVFTIKNCRLEWRYNYSNGQEALKQVKRREDGVAYNPEPIGKFLDPLNRRLTAIIEIDKNPIAYDDIDITDVNQVVIDPTDLDTKSSLKMIFLEQNLTTSAGKGLTTTNPAVFETEKQNEEKLDIYYEASEEIPIDLNVETLKRFIPVGSTVNYPGDTTLLQEVQVVDHVVETSPNGLSNACIILAPYTAFNATINTTMQALVTNEEKIAFETPSGDIIYLQLIDSNVAGFLPKIWVSNHTVGSQCSISLNWYNCISFGNGVESIYLKDSFNKEFINKGVKVSSTIEGEYKPTYKSNGLIYSGLYNENSETNNLNQFIMAEKITKEVNPTYGSIQKLHARDTDLITLCEDKVLQILANKDAVFNADGDPQLVSTNRVLGQVKPFVGEYGISKNPESFASESYRAYFTDKSRGAVIRLSKDGLTPISDHGMKDWFRDNLKLADTLIGSYDSYNKEYNITLHSNFNDDDYTLSFKENVRGWVSFKSFIVENGLSCTSDYYTWGGDYPQNKLWKHNSKNVDRNTFYNVFKPSSVDVILNDSPGIVKTFHTLNYEGSQGRYDEESSYDTYLPGTNVVQDTYASTNFKDLYAKSGWYVVELETDKEKGQVRSFVEKEGKWFNYIHGRAGGTGVTADATRTSRSAGQVTGYFDNADINFQGLGTIQTTPVVGGVYGCTDPTALNYDANAAYDDPLNPCIAIITGCMNPSASNYDINANTDDGSCIHPGCTDCGLYWESITGITCLTQTGTAAFDAGSINFDPNANTDDSSCIPVVLGCTDPAAFNYNSSAHMDDGSCIAVVLGCTDPTQFNYDASANTNDGSCVPVISGCTTSTALNYNASANTDDGSCNNVACNDSDAFNYNANSTASTDCLYCNNPTNTQVSHTFTSTDTTGNTSLYVSWDAPTFPDAIYDYGVAYAPVINGVVGAFTGPNMNTATSGATNFTITGLNDNTQYMIVVQSFCWDGVGTPGIVTSDNIFATSIFGDAGAAYNIPELIAGCTTSGSLNYNSSANFDDDSCIAIINGCTDPIAFNYDPLANTDDPLNPCIPVVNGCTDPINLAYNPNANTDDGSCLTYDPGVVSGDANDDGEVNLADLTLVINHWLHSTYNADGTPGDQDGDVNGDGLVDLADLTLVINNWLQSGSSEFASNGGWDGLVLEQINMTENELVTDPEFNNASAWTTPPTGNDPYGNQNHAGSSAVNINNSGLALIIAGGPLQSTWYWWSVHQNVGFVVGNTYEISFRARQINGSGNLQLSQGYNIFFDQAITSTFTDYTVSFTAVNTFPGDTDVLAIGGAVSTDVFEIEYVSTGTSPLPNHNCYRLYATFDLTNTNYTNHKLLQVFADEFSPSVVMSSADFWNGATFGSHANLQSEVSPGTWFMFPQLEYDTWVAIGDSYTSAPSTIGDVGFSASVLLGSGNSWSFGGTVNSDAAIYRQSNQTEGNADVDGRVLLGQFTTTGDITAINMNFRGTFTDGDGNTQNWQKRNVSSYTIINL